MRSIIAAFVSLLGVSMDACAQPRVPSSATLSDRDADAIPDLLDPCPVLSYQPAFDFDVCALVDFDPSNDAMAECRARDRIATYIHDQPRFMTHIAFAVVRDGTLHFADAFEYLGNGVVVHDPEGITRLYRIGSTTKSLVAVTAMVMHEQGELSLDDFVNPDDASQEFKNPLRRLRHLLSHQGAFKLDNGAIHLFCYPGTLAEFWAEPSDLISPHFDTPPYGNLGGGYEYSAFNYSLAGAYLANRAGQPFAEVVQSRLFDAAGMCTASFDGARAASTENGSHTAYSQEASMHTGPYINLVSPTDPLCEDNFFSTDDVYGDPYTWQPYRLDEVDAEARDPAGGAIASVIDLAHFTEALLESYHTPDGLLSPEGVRELWAATADLGCGSCPYQRYYAMGFFSGALPGQPVNEVEHGGVRPAYTSALVIRPESNTGVTILVNANVNSSELSGLAKLILDDFED